MTGVVVEIAGVVAQRDRHRVCDDSLVDVEVVVYQDVTQIDRRPQRGAQSTLDCADLDDGQIPEQFPHLAQPGLHDRPG